MVKGELIATPQSVLSPSGLLLIMMYFYYVVTCTHEVAHMRF
jgi:hypothetical protein